MTVVGRAPRRVFRSPDGRLVGGVAAGLADHLGLDVLVVRTAFVVTVLLGGLGAVLYAVFWAVVPVGSPDPDLPPRPAPRGQLVGFAVLGVMVLFTAQLIGVGAGVVWPVAVAVTGAAILWRQADDSDRSAWRVFASRGAAGVVLVVVGLAAFLSVHVQTAQVRRAVVPMLVVVVGCALVGGPWLAHAVRQLSAERTARIREQERVKIAGRVHDSTLQTLALISQHVDDPAQVLRLVRRSERELRSWLYSPSTSGTLSAAMAEACADIEEHFPVVVELVFVGDCPMTERLQSLVRAAREAAINAAKHAGVSTVSVYVEVTDDQVVLFVRDRGCGFDPDDMPEDRYGVRESILAAVRDQGGSASIRSSDATGTEVQLSLPIVDAAVP